MPRGWPQPPEHYDSHGSRVWDYVAALGPMTQGQLRDAWDDMIARRCIRDQGAPAVLDGCPASQGSSAAHRADGTRKTRIRNQPPRFFCSEIQP